MSWFKKTINTASKNGPSEELIDPFNASPESNQEYAAQVEANKELSNMDAIAEDREKEESARAEQLVIVHEAKIKMGAHLGEFKVLNDVPTTQDKLTGTTVEKTIPNFTFYDGFQLLNILGDWQDYGSYLVQDNEVLIKKSRLQVMGKMPGSKKPETGYIEFIDSGQVNMPEQISTKGAPVPEVDIFIVNGFWSSDKAGSSKITKAFLGDSVFFHIETQNVPDGKHIACRLVDREKDKISGKTKDSDLRHGKDVKLINYYRVNNNKAIIELKLDYDSMFSEKIASNAEKALNLYFACSYENQNVDLPKKNEDYLYLVEKEPLIIYVSGYWNTKLPYAGTEWGAEYWGSGIKSNAKKYFNAKKEFFINGAGTKGSSGKNRYSKGKEFCEERFSNSQSKFYQEVFKNRRRLMLVTHSMGAAFAEGMLSFLQENQIPVEKVLHLSPADNSDFRVTLPTITYQIDIVGDPVLMYKNSNDKYIINGIQYAGLVSNPKKDVYGHMHTKVESFVWKWFEDLEKINFDFVKVEEKVITLASDGLGPRMYQTLRTNLYKSSNVPHKTVFKRVVKKNKTYHLNDSGYYEISM